MSRFALVARPRVMVALMLACQSASTARGVVVSATHDEPTLVAPGDDPGWNNVAHRGSASAVYLGNRWVLTANHVGTGPVRFSDGQSINVLAGTSFQLSNAGLPAFGSPDLRMFRLVEDPGLPSLEIATSLPSFGSSVLLIGAGRDRVPGLVGWDVTGTGEALVWNSVPLPQANVFGYALASTSQMRWGTNHVSGGQFVIENNTLGFAMNFDRPGTFFEAQASVGDSGGAVFYFHDDGSWKLAGIMTNQQLLANQPEDTLVFGNATDAADLSAYRGQIVDWVANANTMWQNQANHFDVNRSLGVTPLDVLLVINDLQVNGVHGFSVKPSAASFLLDASGDGQVSSLDAIQVINQLIAQSADEATALPAVALAVPEPSTCWLAVLGAFLAALARYAWAARWRSR
jgi:hypothetical protein